MNPFLELQLLILQNPELAALQHKIDNETKGMSSYVKCLYLEQLMLDNVTTMTTLLQELREKTKNE